MNSLIINKKFQNSISNNISYQLTSKYLLVINLEFIPKNLFNLRIQTIIDIEHDSVTGCALQIFPLNNDYAKLDWICNGEALSLIVPYEQLTCIECGYSLDDMRAWLLAPDCNDNSLILNRSPLPVGDVNFGIGHWLGGHGREFFGEIKRLSVVFNDIKPQVTVTNRLLKKKFIPIINEQLPKSAPVKSKNIISQKMKKLDGFYDFLPPFTWLSVLELKNGSLIEFQDLLLSRPQFLSDGLFKFLEKIQNEELVGAAHYLNQFVDAGYGIRIFYNINNSSVDVIFYDGPFNFEDLTQDLLKIDFKIYFNSYLINSFLIANFQSLYRICGRKKALQFATEYYSLIDFPSPVFEDVDLAQSKLEMKSDGSEHMLIKNLAKGGLDYMQYFKGKFCNHPFDDFEIRSDGAVFVCCPSYLPVSIGNIFNTGSIDELSNSDDLFKIKDSIYSQNFKYCSWIKCGKILNGNFDSIPAIQKQGFVPIEFRLSYDPTCNLWCPSCRAEKIVAVGVQRDRFMKLTDDIVIPLLKNAEKCMMNGYGDIFASRACRKILQTVNEKDFPRLKFNFITNGVLLTRDEWSKFPNIHNMVHSIRVSIDAATEITYNKLRLGGDWTVLKENLLFMADLRRESVIGEFMISIVIQDDNYNEMLDFAKLAVNLNCDTVIFEPIINWNVFSPDVFKLKAVHYSDHPNYSEFMFNLENMRSFMESENKARIESGRESVDVSVNF